MKSGLIFLAGALLLIYGVNDLIEKDTKPKYEYHMNVDRKHYYIYNDKDKCIDTLNYGDNPTLDLTIDKDNL